MILPICKPTDYPQSESFNYTISIPQIVAKQHSRSVPTYIYLLIGCKTQTTINEGPVINYGEGASEVLPLHKGGGGGRKKF